MAIYRERLKSKSGCLRCRQRHTKCDEAKPICSFCRRWNLVCKYEDSPRPYEVDQARLRKSQKPPPQESSSVEARRNQYDLIVLTTEIAQNKIITYLQQFCNLIVHQNLPFKNLRVQNSVACGWFESAIHDELACFALLTHWAKDRWRISGCREMHLLGLNCEARTITLLRQRIESKAGLTEEVLLAAAIYYMSASIEVLNPSRLVEMLHGIRAVIDCLGGIDQVARRVKSSTMFSVQHADIFNALVHATMPSFTVLDKPSLPKSFSSILSLKDTRSQTSLLSAFDSEVLEVAESTKFLLFFRIPSQQTRDLSDEEYTYLCSLEYWLNYRLSLLQCQYAGTASLNELIVLAIIIVKMEVVAAECSHPVLVLAILKRLKAAIVSCRSALNDVHQALALFDSLASWACVVALVGHNLPHERSWFSCYLRMVLQHRYGEDSSGWPHCVEDTLRSELQLFPWHHRMDLCLDSICATLNPSPV